VGGGGGWRGAGRAAACWVFLTSTMWPGLSKKVCREGGREGVARIIGQPENTERFLAIALWQGLPKKVRVCGGGGGRGGRRGGGG
jgi:hypothetical protein